MDSSNRILWIALIVVTLAVGALFLQPRVEQVLLPEPVAARVAIEAVGTGIAVEGPVDLEVGQGFRLHAVLEARGRDGETVWYTEAPALRLGDGREIPAEATRRWQRRPEVKVRWFTVEGLQPFLETEPDGDLGRFEVQPFLRADWPLAWSVPGEIEAAHDDALRRPQAIPRQIFGIQRYLVQVELYEREDGLLPSRRIRSAGPEQLLQDPDGFPTARLLLPFPLGPVSEVFGQTQIAVRGGAEPTEELRRAIDGLARQDLAFSRATLIRDQIRGAGSDPGSLVWEPVETGAGARWGERLAGGDLVRAGDRIVVLWQDQGAEGELDGDDLCFDFVQGPAVRRLGEVFLTGDGQLELARLTS